MSTSTAASGKTGWKAKHSSLPRWHRLFYLLVAFAVFTVSLSLYLSHQFMQIYVRSVAMNQAWVERQHDCARLGQLAASVNAPGNNVFQSHQVEIEAKIMQASLLLFNERLATFQEELRDNVDSIQSAPLLAGLQTVRQAMQEMTTEAQRLFAHLKNHQATKAGEAMAAMDRHYANLNRQLEHLRDEIAAIQEHHFENQTGVATSLQRFENVVATLILLMTGGALIYGHKVRRQVESTTREKEGYIEALRESEAQLDRRVNERTAELVKTNKALHKEIEERRRAEQALRESEGCYRQLIESTHDMIQSVSPEGAFLFVNPAWMETFGYAEADLAGLNLFNLVSPAGLPRFRSLFARVVAGEPMDHVEATLVAKDGRLVEVEGNATTRALGGRLMATHCYFRDVTERKEAARVRRQLLKKVMSAQEDERRRIAQDLHDEIGQSLTSLLIGLRTVAAAPTLETAHGRAEELRGIAVATLEEVGRLARGLRPSVLDDLGLMAALDRYASDYAKAHGIVVEVQPPDPALARLPEEVDTALYRIAQEALTNTAKHAAARHVHIAVERQPSFVQLIVADDGRGFQSQTPRASRQLGLSGMRERAALLDGCVSIESEPGSGTRITVRIPLAEENHGEDSCAGGR